MNNRVKMHEEICKKLTETYKNKNTDYGNSFAKTRQEFPDAILIRIMDKFERLKTLNKSEEIQCKDESITDTLLDLANYCIMEVIEKTIEEDEEQLNVFM